MTQVSGYTCRLMYLKSGCRKRSIGPYLPFPKCMFIHIEDIWTPSIAFPNLADTSNIYTVRPEGAQPDRQFYKSDYLARWTLREPWKYVDIDVLAGTDGFAGIHVPFYFYVKIWLLSWGWGDPERTKGMYSVHFTQLSRQSIEAKKNCNRYFKNDITAIMIIMSLIKLTFHWWQDMVQISYSRL